MKYLKEFATQADYEAAVAAGLAKPNVSLINEPFGVQYKKYVPLGVFIQHKNGSLYKSGDWVAAGFSYSDVNGVAVITEMMQVVVAKSTRTGVAWADESELIDGIVATESSSEAAMDFAGKNNTKILMDVAYDNAGKYCNDYIFPNGKRGYLPSAGEFMELDKVYNDLRGALAAIGGSPIYNDKPYLTSTQWDAISAWSLYKLSDNSSMFLRREGKQNLCLVRPFCEL